MLPKTFCVLPFYHINISNDGTTRLCCRSACSIMSDGQCMSLHQKTFNQIWNSDYLRSVRGRMLEGTEIEDCVNCYETEVDGGTSLRQVMNSVIRDIVLEVPGDDQILEKAEAIVHDHDCNAPPPATLQLWLGNLCNLKCRICSPMFSSQIALDSVHSKWREDDQSRSARLLIPDWTKSEKIVFEEILAHPEYLKLIQFVGGEPLINPVLPIILEKLIDTGHAAHITLYANSNGTMYSRRLLSLLRKFYSVEIAFSIDGIDGLQEYIRYPSKWEAISRNIFAFQKENLPISISIYSTAQAYNIFDLLDLARWCQKYGLRFSFDNILYSPRSLSLDMLPQVVIDEALQDWVEYLDKECTEDNRWHVETVIAALRRPRPEASELTVLQDEFIRFTNDLDQSRGQSFAKACPRLHDRLIAAGFDFCGKHRFFQSQQQKLQLLQEENSNLRDQLSQSRSELSQAKEEIKAMKSSKFWKMRILWFSIKHRLGLTKTEG